jgi:TRAP-type C4-dicarboxylate transport system substrate-binding protein
MIRIIAFILIVLFTGQAQAIRIKIATISPEGSVWMKKMREGAQEVSRRTENRIKIKFYPGGVMGDDKAVLRKIRIGQLQGGAFVSGSISQFYPDNQIYSLPLFFRSFEEIDYVRGYLDQKIIDGFERGGFIIFGIAEGGFAYVMSTVPIYTVEDMRNQKVWIPDNDSMILEAIKAFDITPIPLSIADVRAGLQTGLINTVTTPPIGALALQWHTQIKYLLDEPFLYIYGVLAVDRKIFKRISPADQQTFRDVMGNVFKALDRRNREDNIKALETLHKQGVKFIKPSSEALKIWREDASEVPNRLVKTGSLSQKMVNTLESLIKEYRSKKGGQNP